MTTQPPIYVISPAGYLTRLHYDLTVQYAVVELTTNRLIAVFTTEQEAQEYRTFLTNRKR